MWCAVVETATGRLHTVTESPAEENPDARVWTWVALAEKPDFQRDDWNADARVFNTRPAPVFGNRIDDILADSGLPIGARVDRAGLRAVMGKYFSVEESTYTT